MRGELTSRYVCCVLLVGSDDGVVERGEGSVGFMDERQEAAAKKNFH